MAEMQMRTRKKNKIPNEREGDRSFAVMHHNRPNKIYIAWKHKPGGGLLIREKAFVMSKTRPKDDSIMFKITQIPDE